MSRFRKIIVSLTNAANTVAIIGLLISYAAPYVNPQDFWLIAFFGLTYKFWVGLNLALALAWLFTKRKRWVYNALAILIGFGFLIRNVQFNSAESNKDSKDFSIVSFNTNVQFVYNGGNTSESIEKYLMNNDVDIAVLIEWLDKQGNVSKVDYPHQQFIKLNAKRNRYNYGLRLVSKHKIVDWHRIDFGHHTNNMSAYYDIEINGEIIRLVACHLQGNGLGSRDYQRMKKIGFDEEYQQYAKNILNRLKRAFNYRAVQTHTVLKEIEDSPYPVILVGDFNDTPQSYAYSKLRGNRKDAFIESGSGWGSTYLKPFSLLRIDYMLYDEDVKCNFFETTNAIQSDHKLLYGEFSF